jgi:hypothetical protein
VTAPREVSGIKLSVSPAVTSSGDESAGQLEDRRRVRESGFDYHLIKPVDLADISRNSRSGATR